MYKRYSVVNWGLCMAGLAAAGAAQAGDVGVSAQAGTSATAQAASIDLPRCGTDGQSVTLYDYEYIAASAMFSSVDPSGCVTTMVGVDAQINACRTVPRDFIGGGYLPLTLVPGQSYDVHIRCRDHGSMAPSAAAEVLIGTTAPRNGVDYCDARTGRHGTPGTTRLLRWDRATCPGWDGDETTACAVRHLSFTATASTMYLVLKGSQDGDGTLGVDFEDPYICPSGMDCSIDGPNDVLPCGCPNCHCPWVEWAVRGSGGFGDLGLGRGVEIVSVPATNSL